MSGAIKKSNKSVFGHTHVFTGYVGGIPYLTPKRCAVDNIGIHHVNLYGLCDICNKEILLARIHVNSETDEVNFKDK